MSHYVVFPGQQEVLARLRGLAGAGPGRDALYRLIAERLAGKTMDSAAFAMFLIETLHRHEAAVGEDLANFLPRAILALSGDEDLAASARRVFGELRAADDD